RRDRIALDVVSIFVGKAMVRGQVVGALLAAENERTFGRAQARRRLHQRVEHDLQVEGRAANDLEHVGGGGLLLQRFAKLVEQPRVLDGDDGLISEILDQPDLFVGERADFLPVDGDRTDQLVLFEHRDTEKGTGATGVNKPNERRGAFDVGLLRPKVRNVNNLPCTSDTPKRKLRAGVNDWLTTPLFNMRCRSMQRYGPEPLASQSHITPNFASQMRVAFSSIVWNTGSNAPGELEMT